MYDIDHSGYGQVLSSSRAILYLYSWNIYVQ